MSVVEISHMEIRAGLSEKFVVFLEENVSLIAQGIGCRDVLAVQEQSHADRFIIVIEWESLADPERYYATEEFARFRTGVAEYLARPPTRDFCSSRVRMTT
jgi:heme-degrading monooxygenase HmoA